MARCGSLLARHAGRRVPACSRRHYNNRRRLHPSPFPPTPPATSGTSWLATTSRTFTGPARSFAASSIPLSPLHLSACTSTGPTWRMFYDTMRYREDRYQLVAGRERFRARLHTTSRTRTRDRCYLERIAPPCAKQAAVFLGRHFPGPGAVGGPAMRWPAMREARPTWRESARRDHRRRAARRRARRPVRRLLRPAARAGELSHARAPGPSLSLRRRGVSGRRPRRGSPRTILPSIERAGGAVVTSAGRRAHRDRGRPRVGRARGPTAACCARRRGARCARVTYGHSLTRWRGAVAPGPGATPPSFAPSSLRRPEQDRGGLGSLAPNLWSIRTTSRSEPRRYVADPEAPLRWPTCRFPRRRIPYFERRHPARHVEVIA